MSKVICLYCHALIREKDGAINGVTYGACAICRTLPETEQQRIHEQTLEMEAAREPYDSRSEARLNDWQ